MNAPYSSAACACRELDELPAKLEHDRELIRLLCHN